MTGAQSGKHVRQNRMRILGTTPKGACPAARRNPRPIVPGPLAAQTLRKWASGRTFIWGRVVDHDPPEAWMAFLSMKNIERPLSPTGPSKDYDASRIKGQGLEAALVGALQHLVAYHTSRDHKYAMIKPLRILTLKGIESIPHLAAMKLTAEVCKQVITYQLDPIVSTC